MKDSGARELVVLTVTILLPLFPPTSASHPPASTSLAHIGIHTLKHVFLLLCIPVPPR